MTVKNEGEKRDTRISVAVVVEGLEDTYYTTSDKMPPLESLRIKPQWHLRAGYS